MTIFNNKQEKTKELFGGRLLIDLERENCAQLGDLYAIIWDNTWINLRGLGAAIRVRLDELRNRGINDRL